MTSELRDLMQKNYWTDEDRAVFTLGGRAAYERAQLGGAIKQIQRRLASCNDKAERADLLTKLDIYQDRLAKLTPVVNPTIAAE